MEADQTMSKLWSREKCTLCNDICEDLCVHNVTMMLFLLPPVLTLTASDRAPFETKDRNRQRGGKDPNSAAAWRCHSASVATWSFFGLPPRAPWTMIVAKS